MIDSVIGDNIPILTEQEKFNETVTSSVKRIESSLTGEFLLHCCCVLEAMLCPFTMSSQVLTLKNQTGSLLWTCMQLIQSLTAYGVNCTQWYWTC